MNTATEKIPVFIRDVDLHQRFGDKAYLIVDGLDRDTSTQKGLATVPFDARPRESVEKWLRAHGYLRADERL